MIFIEMSKRALKCCYANQIIFRLHFSEKFTILHSFNMLLLNTFIVREDIYITNIYIYSTLRNYLYICLVARKSN